MNLERPIQFCFVSPCVMEEKDQDRAALIRHDEGWIAVLCDGTTRSMHSGDAARIATFDPAALWTERGLTDIVARLNERRAMLIAEANDDEPDPSSFLSLAMANFVREARQSAFQTTFVTARVTPANSGRFVVEAKTVGDSALFVFDGSGDLLRSNLPGAGLESGFGHASSITEVLPDHFRSDDVTLRAEVEAGAHIVLCSDGFYDAFSSPAELLRWLLDHENDFRSGFQGPVIDALHERLDKRTGDDDLSFIWLCPEIMPPESEAVPAAVIENASAADAPEHSWPYRVAVAFIRRLRAMLFRSSNHVHGENAS